MRLLVVIALLFSVAAPTRAQPAARPKEPKPSRYIPFDFDPDAEALVRQHLADAELEQLKKLIDKVDPKLIEELRSKDPAEQKRLKEWVEQQIKNKPPTTDEVKKKLEEFRKETPKEERPEGEPSQDKTPPKLDNKPAEIKEEPGREWMKKRMEEVQDSKVGDMLRDSPTFQKALENLRTSLREPKGDGFDLDKLAGHIDKLKLGENRWSERISDVIKPDKLPRFDWNPPAPQIGALPNVPAPSLPAMSALGTLAIWLIVIVLAALLLWQAARWLKLGRRTATASFGLGPWPVDPQQVATRAELVQAFDYLALLVFGTRARPWNHQAVARSLAERSELLANTAAALAALYEEARYAEGDALLSPDQRELARQALAKLAGVAV